MTFRSITACTCLVAATLSWAADEQVEAAVGGGVGGAIGAAVGQDIGDKKGAIVGSAIGAAIGTAIALEDHDATRPTQPSADRTHVEVIAAPAHPKTRHCPPGQAKKGRC